MGRGIIDQMSASIDRRDEQANIDLAEKIAATNDQEAVMELIDLFDRKKHQSLQNDAIKILYEIGLRKPGLIAAYVSIFVSLLGHKNNRLQWGGMTALASIVDFQPEVIHPHLAAILDASDKGTVITRDYTVRILAGLCKVAAFREDVMILLLDMVAKSPENQFPMYSEICFSCDLNPAEGNALLDILQSRILEMEKETKQRRILRLIHKLNK